MRKLIFATAVALVCLATTFKSRAELSERAMQGLALQYIYMELCKDSPPLPPDRLRTVDAMTEMVDKSELQKSVIKLHDALKLSDETRVAKFCSDMATMIKNEKGHEQ